jgi:hypothetical protein
MVLNLDQGRRYYRATATADGLLSAADFSKLDALQVPVTRLSYAPGTDLLNAAALVAGTFADIHANQSFTVGSATAQSLLILRMGLIATSAATNSLGLRLVFNSAGTPINVAMSGGIVAFANGYGVLTGGALWLPAAFLPTGTNTVKAQVVCAGAATAYCRGSSTPATEPYNLQIVEVCA